MDQGLLLAVGAVGLGCIFGSFLNALSFRFNTGRTMGGRSRCMRCGHTLAAVDLVPVLSYLVLRGRCRYCGTRISPQYPLVEVVAGLLSLGVFVTVAGSSPFVQPSYSLVDSALLYAYFLCIWLIILFIVVYDLRHQIIPWSASVVLAVLAFLALFLSGAVDTYALLAGPLLAAPLFLLSLVSRGRWMGWGDSLFELSLGWLLGCTAGLTALMLAVWCGAAVGVLLLFVQRVWRFRAGWFTIKSEIPFAPFLALGAALVYFCHVNFFSTLSSFF